MKVFYLFCFFLFSTTRPVCYSTEDASAYSDLHQFNLWRIKYNKTYEHKTNLTSQFSAWKKNREFINKHNEKSTDYELELNYFADLHHSQWLHRKAYNQVMAEHTKKHKSTPLDDEFNKKLYSRKMRSNYNIWRYYRKRWYILYHDVWIKDYFNLYNN